MRTLAILPVKSMDDAKQRLADELSPGTRRALVEAMVCDVVVALTCTNSIDEVLVVTGDNEAEQIAARYGAQLLADDDSGHNAAAQRAIGEALRAGAERVLLVPGDCPMLDPGQLEELLARPVGARSALVVPDRHGTGTNALLLRPPDALAPSFGPGSCQRHIANARGDNTIGEIVEVPSLALDVDTADDFQALRAALATTHGGAARTRGMLSQLLRSTE